MRLTRVYVEAPVTPGKPLVVEGTAANHITRVLRLRSGDALIIFDGTGGEFDARIDEFRKESVVVICFFSLRKEQSLFSEQHQQKSVWQ